MKQFVMGDEAIARGALEAGVKVVSGYPGTPATEIVEAFVDSRETYVEWSTNEKVATELALGASLAGVRSLAVMKHNGTNVATDFIMHMNFTGIRGGMVLVSADDPGANSSQNEEDTRILTHVYGHLPVLDPCTPAEAKEMVKLAFRWSEETESCFVLRPVMRVCHAREPIEFEEVHPLDREVNFINDRSRYVMSAVVERSAGGKMRPVWRHELLNKKQAEFERIMEECPFNWLEEGEGRTGLIGCGIGYTYVKEVEKLHNRKFQVLKLGTLPLPVIKVLAFLKKVDRVVVFEEVEPVVARMLREICYKNNLKVEILGRDGFLPEEGELSTATVINALEQLGIVQKGLRKETIRVAAPLRTRTQCVGCGHRGLLSAMKRVSRKNKALVTGDIGCHDAGSFVPLELQSTIYCMGSSIPMAAGIKAAGFDKPVMAIIGDSTFFHTGIPGLISAAYNGANITVVIADNRTTAMTGFQPHPGVGENIKGESARRIDIMKLAKALDIPVRVANPYNVAEMEKTLTESINEEGVSIVISEAPCYLRSTKLKRVFFEPGRVEIDPDRCNGCRLCITDFGCPALRYKDKKVQIDRQSCVDCGLCAQICQRGAIK